MGLHTRGADPPSENAPLTASDEEGPSLRPLLEFLRW